MKINFLFFCGGGGSGGGGGAGNGGVVVIITTSSSVGTTSVSKGSVGTSPAVGNQTEAQGDSGGTGNNGKLITIRI